MKLDIYLHPSGGFSLVETARLCRIESKLNKILEEENIMAGELDTLKNDVAANGDVVGSAITLLNGLKAQLDAAIASGDPAALKALSDSLEANNTALATAVASNTTAAPATTTAGTP